MGLRAAPESAAIVSIASEYGLFVDGEFAPAQDGKQLMTLNPATEEALAEVAMAGPADVDRAVAAARAAYEQTWGPMPGAERAKYLYRIARIDRRSGPASSRCWRAWTTASRSGSRATSTSRSPPRTSSTTPAGPTSWSTPGSGPAPRPLGVAGQVIPWNFPLLMAAWKLAPALAAGNTCVLKPAETTPLTALVLAEMCQQAGLPPGVVNVLTGAGDDRRGAGRATPAWTRWRSPAPPRSARRSAGRWPAPASG